MSKKQKLNNFIFFIYDFCKGVQFENLVQKY